MPEDTVTLQDTPTPNAINRAGDDGRAYEDNVDPSIRAAVKLWNRRVDDARKHWEDDYKRMRRNMRFVRGLQWNGQNSLVKDSRYVNNATLRVVKQKVSSLYAKNPKTSHHVRDRMVFQLWDETPEMLRQALMQAEMGDLGGLAVLMDYQKGTEYKKQMVRFGKTVNSLYEWNVSRQEPEFKTQMKKLVGRAVITGTGFVKLDYQRPESEPLVSTTTRSSLQDRQKRVEELSNRFENENLDSDGPEVEELKNLLQSLQDSNAPEDERLVFEFPTVTSVVVDPKCTSLRGFQNADWVCIEYLLPIEEVNSHFGVDIKPNLKDVTLYSFEDTASGGYLSEVKEDKDSAAENHVRVREIFCKKTRNTFFIAQGWCNYLQPPEAVFPRLSRFWPVFALTFNELEVEPNDDQTSPYPPSDVDLAFHSQKERNRSREELKKHRRANRPKYFVPKGVLRPNDKRALLDLPSNVIVELEASGENVDVNKLISKLEHSRIDPAMYDTAPVDQDLLLATGMQEANLGPANTTGNATATSSSISEQSRLSVTASDVDDLDDFLTELALAGGETLIQEASLDVVMNVVGPGAFWPMADREPYLREVYLDIEAASSGRPNKALELANYERVVPFLIQAGAQPSFIIKEGIKRLDDRLDVTAAFPLLPPQMPSLGVGGGGGTGPAGAQTAPPAGPQQPILNLPPGAASMPLAGQQ